MRFAIGIIIILTALATALFITSSQGYEKKRAFIESCVAKNGTYSEASTGFVELTMLCSNMSATTTP